MNTNTKVIKYKDSNFRDTEREVSTFVEHHLWEWNPFGETETIRDNLGRTNKAIATMCQVLADKNIFSLEEILEIAQGICVYEPELVDKK